MYSDLVREAFEDHPQFLTARDKVRQSDLLSPSPTPPPSLPPPLPPSPPPPPPPPSTLLPPPPPPPPPQSYKQVVNDVSVFKLDLVMTKPRYVQITLYLLYVQVDIKSSAVIEKLHAYHSYIFSYVGQLVEVPRLIPSPSVPSS